MMQELEMSSSFVGAKLRPLSVSLTARQTMNFAAGIQDQSEFYFDDLRTGGVIAHPMLVGSLTWQISSRLQDNLLAEGFPFHLSRHQVHYSESISWYRPLRPGDQLTIEGQITAILPCRGGTHLVVQYDARDSEGQLIFKEFTGALLRGVRCSDAGRGQIELACGSNDHFATASVPSGAKEKSGASDGDEVLWQKSIPLGRLAAHIYDGCADIYFPIHTSPAFATSVGLPGIIMQGTATAAIAVSELIREEADGDPSRVSALDCRFVGMVFPGSEITVKVLQREKGDESTVLHWAVGNDQGRLAIGEGRLRINNT